MVPYNPLVRHAQLSYRLTMSRAAGVATDRSSSSSFDVAAMKRQKSLPSHRNCISLHGVVRQNSETIVPSWSASASTSGGTVLTSAVNLFERYSEHHTSIRWSSIIFVRRFCSNGSSAPISHDANPC